MNKQTTGKAHVRRELRVRARPLSPRAWPLVSAIAAAAALTSACGGDDDDDGAHARLRCVAQGKQIFRFDTFGDEAQWTDTLRMHEVIAAAVDPITALSVGLKVDAEALPAAVVAGIQNGSIDLRSPATTMALLKLNAVVGLKGTVETVNGGDTLTRVGVTCALCHSTVDNSFAPGIGKRLDGWANRDLNPGAIIALSPALDARRKAGLNRGARASTTRAATSTASTSRWSFRRRTGSTGIHRITFTGDGDEIAYWNRYVAVTQMGGLGTMIEPRLNLNITHGTQDLVSDQAARAAGVPAVDCRAGRRPRAASTPPPPRAASSCSRAGPMRHLPQRRSVHRRERALHPPADSMAEPGDAELRVALGDEAVPHDAAQGRVAAPAVLPRRLGGHAGGRWSQATTASVRSD